MCIVELPGFARGVVIVVFYCTGHNGDIAASTVLTADFKRHRTSAGFGFPNFPHVQYCVTCRTSAHYIGADTAYLAEFLDSVADLKWTLCIHGLCVFRSYKRLLMSGESAASLNIFIEYLNTLYSDIIRRKYLLISTRRMIAPQFIITLFLKRCAPRESFTNQTITNTHVCRRQATKLVFQHTL